MARRINLKIVSFWLLVAVGLCGPVRGFKPPFSLTVSFANIKLLLHKKHPTIPPQIENRVGAALDDWKVDGNVELVLPPMYSGHPFAYAGFLASFITRGTVKLANGPYPHPKLRIIERSDVAERYERDNRSFNAALLTTMQDRRVWPFGYTAWYDLVYEDRNLFVQNPHLVDVDGSVIQPVAVRTWHSSNEATLFGDGTQLHLRHQSPIFWTFPRAGRLPADAKGFTLEEAPDGAEVAWLPPLPRDGDNVLGMYALATLVPPPSPPPTAPAWWSTDQALRRAIVDGRPWPERRALLDRLTRQFPTHPLLPHYRVVARLGTDEFDQAWLEAQTTECDRATWYLLPWTRTIDWQRVRTLPCMAPVIIRADSTLYSEYVAMAAVIRFRALKDDPDLQQLARRVVRLSYLREQYRSFNYPLSDFAWLWLHSR